jgi:hypothetical protein
MLFEQTEGIEMFYIQTQDGDLPYVYKIYKTQKGARKAVLKFLSENHQDGSISVVTSMHHGVNNFHRNDGFVMEEISVDDSDDVQTVYHGLTVEA